MIYRDRFVIELSFHARKRAMRRNISFDMIEATLKTGKIERFGKNRFRFISKYKRGNVVCIGERKSGNYIKIFTIEWG